MTSIKRALVFVRQDTGTPWKVSKPVIRSLIRFIELELSQGGEVTLEGLGIFRVRKQRGWTGVRRLRGGEERILTSPDVHLVSFKPARRLRIAVKNKMPELEKTVDAPPPT